MGADAKRKEARKRRFGHIESHSQSVGVTATTTTRTTLVEVREDPKPATHQINRVLEGRGEIASSVIERTTQPGNSSEVQENPTSSKQARFICFIGNLPYSATTESITKHFAKVKPAGVRHSTNKETGRSKGFAFLEFSGYDRMKTCLHLYHHSTFDDGSSSGRKINVELTSGGGGAKSKDRKGKLHAKNRKLNEERKRRAISALKLPKTNADLNLGHGLDGSNQMNIHPSRRDRVSN